MYSLCAHNCKSAINKIIFMKAFYEIRNMRVESILSDFIYFISLQKYNKTHSTSISPSA